MKRAVLVLGLLAAVAWGAAGHPHVFIDTRVEVSLDDTGLNGFWITWRFDRVFTASILLDFDRDRDKRLSPSEVADIEREAFSNLVHYNYFTYIRSPRGLHAPESVRQFTAYIEEERVHYRFFVPYPLPLGREEVTVNLAIYDETFFCDIGYHELAPVLFPASDTIRGSYEIRRDRGIRIDYPANDGSQGATFPHQIVLRLRRVS